MTRQLGHKALQWNKEMQKLETFDPNPPTIEELCERREELLRVLSWVELEITRSRKPLTSEMITAERLNEAAEYFPRVRSGDIIGFVNHLKK